MRDKTKLLHERALLTCIIMLFLCIILKLFGIPWFDILTANFQLSQQAQSANIVQQLRPCPVPAYLTCSPYFAYNSGCGCGCNGNFNI